jgi:hypothetical protein
MEGAMSKVGRLRPEIVVNHDKGGFKGGWLTIEATKLFGFSSDRIFACSLDSPEGKGALAQLTCDAKEDSAEATPLGAFVRYVKDCTSVADVQERCKALLARSASGQ